MLGKNDISMAELTSAVLWVRLQARELFKVKKTGRLLFVYDGEQTRRELLLSLALLQVCPRHINCSLATGSPLSPQFLDGSRPGMISRKDFDQLNQMKEVTIDDATASGFTVSQAVKELLDNTFVLFTCYDYTSEEVYTSVSALATALAIVYNPVAFRVMYAKIPSVVKTEELRRAEFELIIAQFLTTLLEADGDPKVIRDTMRQKHARTNFSNN